MPDIKTKTNGTCFTWSLDLTFALMVRSWVKGWQHNLNVLSINHVLALLRNWSCFSVAKTRWCLLLTVTSAQKSHQERNPLPNWNPGLLGLWASWLATCARNFGFERLGHGPSSFLRRTYRNEKGKKFYKLMSNQSHLTQCRW